MAQLSNTEPLDYKLKKLNKDRYFLTIKLQITKQFKIRMFIGNLLVKLSASILGCGIELQENEKINEIEKEIDKIIEEIRTEINSRPQQQNIGKLGCLRRVLSLKEKHFLK